jgi:DNA-cytosine methyltransferase|tara:strand:- start:776 stop:1903 length:1128 start_codon:yes stop_codon:yes gene_type:complete
MRVLSLFDGMGCFRIALDRAGIPVTKYYASEIDPYPIKVAKANYPEIVHLGDVQEIEIHNGLLRVKVDNYGMPKNWENHEKIDLLVGGSPCQGFSFAGKQLNFDDPRSKLFWEYVRLLKELKPTYFLLENVKMKQQYQDIISDALGVKPIEINSSLVSPQCRKRLYWTNIPDVTKPDDKGLVLRDIIEDGFVDRDKAHCLDANYWKGGNLKSYFQKHRRQLVFSDDGLCHVGDADLNGHDILKRVYHIDGKSPTLTTMQGGNREPKILCGAWRGRYVIDGVRQDHKQETKGLTKQRLEVRLDEKTNALTTVQKDNVAVSLDALRWRKLTPLECERLQTVPDNYTNHVSNTQRYKMLGNGFTVDVIAHIIKNLTKT